MSWQKCPICFGEGKVENGPVSPSIHSICPVCHGARIISEVAGLPPYQAKEDIKKDIQEPLKQQ